jgi:mannose-1-phosphate guanylyltransferase/mannose-6-phosphate isomerase
MVKMSEIALQPVILAGGGGTRLWPLSREHYPKQFLALVDDASLLQNTVRRTDGLGGADRAVANPIVICNEEHRFLVAEQLRLLGRDAARIVLEPAGRNTAPALTAAALLAAAGGGDPILLMMPADHAIRDLDRFRDAVATGAALAARGSLVTFGIVPDRPETGYGYIATGDAVDGGAARHIDAFVEKPDTATACQYVESGKYLWNAGIFMMRATVWIEAIRAFRPDILTAVEQAVARALADGGFLHLDRQSFTQCPADSVDYAVMEKITRQAAFTAAVVPLDAGWSDVGAWSSLWDISARDADGNVVKGDVCAIDSADSMLVAEHRFLAALGCDGMVVVETADAVMVAPRSRAQDVKKVVEWLKARGREERISHRRVYRPWGSYEGIDAGDRFQVKRITVKPGGKLSLQMHHHRAEHWIVVRGTAQVTRGDEVFLLSENQSTYIPLGVRHRLENPGTIPLEIIEVQSGPYLGEDDIVRFEDVYKRS